MTTLSTDPDIQEALRNKRKSLEDMRLFLERELDSAYKEPEIPDKYRPFEFLHPLELLEYFDPLVQTIKPHPWQVEEILRFAKNYTKDLPFIYSLLANNGSGKDSWIITPCAIWQLLCKIRSRTIITSSSTSQLKLQTESYLRTLSAIINQKCLDDSLCETPPITMQKGHLTCNLTGSEIILFKTDEGGRAEGYHPFRDYPNGEVTIIANEAKTVEDEIFNHLQKCTYSRFMEISSAGKPSGHFYNTVKTATFFPSPQIPGKRYARKITSYDCPHIPSSRIERDLVEWGEASPLFKSTHLSEFFAEGDSVVITTEQLRNCFAKAKRQKLNIGRFAGCDLARGGDENTLYVFEDNEQVGSEKFRVSDTEVTVALLVNYFRKWKLQAENITLDDGNVGAAIIDRLRHLGWPVRHLTAQSKAIKNKLFANRIAECWFKFGRLVDAGLVVLDKNDLRLHTQLTGRYFDQHETSDRIKLESKEDARARGHDSPDRADAVVLAFSKFGLETFGLKFNQEVREKSLARPSMKKIAEFAVPRFNLGRILIPPSTVVVAKHKTPGSLLRSLYGHKYTRRGY